MEFVGFVNIEFKVEENVKMTNEKKTKTNNVMLLPSKPASRVKKTLNTLAEYGLFGDEFAGTFHAEPQEAMPVSHYVNRVF
jgi:hypothetical protein